MNFELIDQSVQYKFMNSKKYGDKGFKNRVMQNVKQNATASGLAQVGKALAQLQNDTLGDIVLVQKQAVPMDQIG
jgi:hypothetical protein